jgi:nitrilase
MSDVDRTRPVDPALNTRYILNSLAVESPEMEKIKSAAKEHSICVALGFSERTETNSLYIAQAIISPQGELVMKRRKLKPTHMVGIHLYAGLQAG